MSIPVVQAKEVGNKYPAVIISSVFDPDGLYGPQIKVTAAEDNGSTERQWLDVPMTPKNRTGRWFAALLGSYPTEAVDETMIVGMTVDMIYALKKGSTDEVTWDAVKPRTPSKGEDWDKVMEQALKSEADRDAQAPF